MRLKTIRDVAEYQLCCGCGACAYVSPDEIEMVDTLEYGRRPLFRNGEGHDPRSGEAMRVCPGIGLTHTFDPNAPGLIHELTAGWGPVLEVWEGYASDPEIRLMGSSGGAATSLGLYCMERGGMHGVLHTGGRSDVPYLNETVMSRTRDEMLARTGSRYAPASPCDGFQRILDAPGPCVFIGKPCDVAAVQNVRRLRPELDHKVGLTIAFFCAGTPTTRGTLALLDRMGIEDPSTVLSLRYRGNGWPGGTVVRFRTPLGEQERELTYEQSWGEVLTNHKQWRCNLCPDHTGEFADIAVGDPWYRRPEPGEPGRSLILARTRRGQDILHAAVTAGYMTLEKSERTLLPASQPNLLKARGAVWGRVWTCRLLAVAVPRYYRIPTWWAWWAHLTIGQKLQSMLGVVKRIVRRRLRHRQAVQPYNVPGMKRQPGSKIPLDPVALD